LIDFVHSHSPFSLPLLSSIHIICGGDYDVMKRPPHLHFIWPMGPAGPKNFPPIFCRCKKIARGGRDASSLPPIPFSGGGEEEEWRGIK
jgi:hypothetical protein